MKSVEKSKRFTISILESLLSSIITCFSYDENLNYEDFGKSPQWNSSRDSLIACGGGDEPGPGGPQ
ncbi:MAG: hypothetical protein HXS48_15425 [Theionarchaea archaeon]|nr:MAG: hypothetical protein AYK19_11785 [Theionarchaea archaeon DG-70-1]MBU7028322.1 hypothetical protein [Theionarchaea archaeon]